MRHLPVYLLTLALCVGPSQARWGGDSNYNVASAGPPVPLLTLIGACGGAAANSGSPYGTVTTADAPAGSDIFVYINEITDNQTISSVTDNATGGSNTYLIVQPGANASVANAAIAYALGSANDLPSGSTWTVTTSGGAQYNIRGAYYISGYNGGLDTTSTLNQSTAGTSVSGVTSGTLGSNRDLVLGYVYANAGPAAITESALFTNLCQNGFNNLSFAFPTSTGTLAYTPSWGTTSVYSAVEASFLPTGVSCSAGTTLNAKLSGSQNSTAVANAICTLVNLGTWAKLDGFYVYATAVTADAKLNWVSTSFNITQHGSCTFTANAGYKGDASSCYNDAGWTPSTAGGNATVNSTAIGGCVDLSRSTPATWYMMGSNDNASTVNFIGIDVNDTGFGTAFGVNQGSGAAATSNALGMWAASRTSSVLTTLYFNGVSVATTTEASGGLSTIDTVLMAYNSLGTIKFFSGDRFAYQFFGGGLTATDMSNIYNTMHTYLTAVGAPAGC